MAVTSILAQRVVRALAASTAATRRWRAVLLGLVVVVSYLTLTSKPLPSIDFGWDKLNHMLAFTALSFSAYLGYPASRTTRFFLLAALVAFGGLIEVLQMFVPSRSSEWGDLIADSIGVACGAVIAANVSRMVSSLSRHWH